MMADDLLSAEDQLEIACGLLDRDERAVRRLLEVYGPKVKWLLREKVGGVLSEDDIQSCLHFAAMRACGAVFDDSRGTMGGWFYTIALNVARDWVKGQRSLAGGVPLEETNEPGVEARVLASVEDDEPPDAVIGDLLVAVEELGDLQKAIAKADLLADGEADAEVLSKKLGIPKQHVYSYREKYKKALLKRMKKRGHTADSVARGRR